MSYIYQQAEKRNQEIKELFPDLKASQIWTLIKIARNHGKYCRSGVASRNYFDSVFKDIAKVERVEKIKEDKTYYGLKVTIEGKTEELYENHAA